MNATTLLNVSAVYCNFVSLSLLELDFLLVCGRLFCCLATLEPYILRCLFVSFQAPVREMETGSLQGKHTKKTAICGM